MEKPSYGRFISETRERRKIKFNSMRKRRSSEGERLSLSARRAHAVSKLPVAQLITAKGASRRENLNMLIILMRFLAESEWRSSLMDGLV